MTWPFVTTHPTSVASSVCEYQSWFERVNRFAPNNTPSTHCHINKMTTTFQRTFRNAFSWIKSVVFWLKFHWCLFLRVRLTMCRYCFVWCLGTVSQKGLVWTSVAQDLRRHIASLGHRISFISLRIISLISGRSYTLPVCNESIQDNMDRLFTNDEKKIPMISMA